VSRSAPRPSCGQRIQTQQQVVLDRQPLDGPVGEQQQRVGVPGDAPAHRPALRIPLDPCGQERRQRTGPEPAHRPVRPGQDLRRVTVPVLGARPQHRPHLTHRRRHVHVLSRHVADHQHRTTVRVGEGVVPVAATGRGRCWAGTAASSSSGRPGRSVSNTRGSVAAISRRSSRSRARETASPTTRAGESRERSSSSSKVTRRSQTRLNVPRLPGTGSGGCVDASSPRAGRARRGRGLTREIVPP